MEPRCQRISVKTLFANILLKTCVYIDLTKTFLHFYCPLTKKNDNLHYTDYA